MKRNFILLGILSFSILMLFNACQKETNQTNQDFRKDISVEVLNQISDLGFSTQNVIKSDNGYIVEGDIHITDEQLTAYAEKMVLATAAEEQYCTYNLVTGLPRVITVYVSTSLPSNYVTATDAAIARYNAESLDITFQKVSSGADIDITAGPWWWNLFGILGQGGFPTAAGDPYNSVMMNSTAFSGAPLGYLTTVIAHEIGHCIGLRHTDYMDRSFSCGGAYDNEGDADVGAVYIPGTSVNPENGSYMLSCTDGSDRPFTTNDVVALNYLY